ncbi:MAG: heavy metal translocating P-type ATPase, partial [Bacillota bacterium]|nr:heavy metal translocating P-type ATPase [Bacillota bacterium]
AYFLVGGKVIRAAIRNVLHGRLFDENFLMTVATGGAIALRELPEAVGVMLFFAVGEFLQGRAIRRSRRSIQALLDIRPDYANLKVDGEVRRVSPREVQVGDLIVVRPGERIPLDGEVVDGLSSLDTSALTGEPLPRRAEPGTPVLAGMVNLTGLLTLRVTRDYTRSSLTRILELVEHARARKAPTEQFFTQFSRYYTPVVVAAALTVAVLPPLLLPGASFSTWVYRALVLLVISCPCALVVSIPLGYFGGIGGAARRGVLVKGANFLDALARPHTVVFDKTGTLTRGTFRVTQVAAQSGFSREEVLRLAAEAEAHSSHPIALSLRQAYGQKIEENRIQSYTEVPGYGVKAVVEGRAILAGSSAFLQQEGVAHEPCDAEGTAIYVAVDGTFAGCIAVSDELKPDAAAAVQRLKELGVQRIALLTGDDEAVAARVAARLGIDTFYARLLPEDKVSKVEELAAQMPGGKQGRQRLVFVGDGINDAPVLARADVGVAMGGLGSDAAIEAADVVIMDDRPSRLATAVAAARRTRRIVLQNIALALVVKGAFIALGAVGMATMWEAVFADMGVALLAIFNSLRALA